MMDWLVAAFATVVLAYILGYKDGKLAAKTDEYERRFDACLERLRKDHP